MKNDANGRSCGVCQWFIYQNPNPVGLCVRMPPRPFPLGAAPSPLVDPRQPQSQRIITQSFHPQVAPVDWCGEWTAVEKYDAEMVRSRHGDLSGVPDGGLVPSATLGEPAPLVTETAT